MLSHPLRLSPHFLWRRAAVPLLLGPLFAMSGCGPLPSGDRAPVVQGAGGPATPDPATNGSMGPNGANGGMGGGGGVTAGGGVALP